MSNASKKLMGTTSAAGGGFTAIEDVFSTYIYTGNGSTQTITNGIDLAGEGGLVWIKSRGDNSAGPENHQLFDTERGANKVLQSNSTLAEATGTNRLTNFNSDGFSVGSSFDVNSPYPTYASWTFRKAPRFFDVVTYTGNGLTQAINHNLGSAPGVIITKRTDIADDWTVYHRSEGATRYGFLHLTNAFATASTRWNDTEPTDTQFFLGNDGGTNGSGGSFVAYLFAHDPLGPSGDGSDGLISCGSYTGNGSTNGPEIDLGWEPQWVLIKNAGAAISGGINCNWRVYDSMRGFTTGGSEARLFPNLNNAENSANDADLTATGFKITNSSGSVNGIGENHIYIAIRRGPMKVPESGTEVFAVDTMAGFTLPSWKSGFPVDMNFWRSKTSAYNWELNTRITNSRLFTNLTNAESAISSNGEMDYSNGFGSNTSTDSQYQAWMFRRAPNFFDVVAYNGDGTTNHAVSHGLGVAPEMMIVKSRSTGNTGWMYYHAGAGNTKALWVDSAVYNPPQFNTGSFWWNNTSPTDTTFTVGNGTNVNLGGGNYIAYLFASLAGVSKVGSYTGNGSSQTIDCGFTTGARFVFIFREDAASDIYVWDTERGIVAANDPHLSLNTTAAEVTTDDSVDPDSSGFIVNQVAATNINVSSASYIFYAIA